MHLIHNTLAIFNVFHYEFALFLVACIRERNVSQLPFEYVITLASEERDMEVVFDPEESLRL